MAPFQVQKGRDYFEGKQNPGVADNEWITINKIYSHLLSELPFLYSIDPFFYIKLKRSFSPDPADIAQFEQRGEIRQSYLNYLKGEVELKTKARLGIMDAEFAYGVMKMHFTADAKDNPDFEKPIVDDDGGPLVDDDGEPLKEPEKIPVNERYRVTRVHPEDILWSEDAGPLEDDWPWIAQRIYMSVDEAQDDPTLNQTALKTAEKLVRARDTKDKKRAISSSIFKKAAEPDGEVYEIWEIYDLKKKQWLKIARGAENLVKKPEVLPKGVDKHPYAILRFTMRDKSPYPIPPVSQALDPQREINESRSKVLVHRKRFNRKYEVNVNLLEDDAELDKLEAGDDGTIIKVQGIGAINPIKDAPLDQQTYTELAALNNDIFEMMGRSGESVGLNTADSATQAALIDKRLEIREGDKLSTVVEWIVNIGRKLDHLVQAHITRDDAVKVVGPKGEFWQMVRAQDFEEIAGDYEYSVNVGATMPRLPQVERQQWMAFLQVLAGFPHLLTSKRLMKNMAELHHIEDEAMLDELFEIGKNILSGKTPAPGQSAQIAGGGADNPITALLGGALGGQGEGGPDATV